jgi:bifunctional DNA-binding transcriptional regulator/antitoxin component of YhaV-PrlF toxin-antitoxin module
MSDQIRGIVCTVRQPNRLTIPKCERLRLDIADGDEVELLPIVGGFHVRVHKRVNRTGR